MELISTCSLPVGSIVWQSWSGAVVLTVVCKATFRLRSMESPLADVQDPIFEADQYWYDDPRAALRVPTDLVPFKRGAEVMVVGHAYAPYGTPVRSLPARLRVAGVDKAVEIFGDRVFTREGRLREVSSPFARVPLLWQYAAGGPGTLNPVGIRHDAPPDPYGQRLIPRFQPSGLRVTRPDDAIPIVGFGPIAPAWPERLAKLHRHASHWDHQGWSRAPLPRDIDAAYFNAAPADQQVEALHADERLMLENLHPELSQVVTSLAPVTPEALVERAGQPAEIAPFLCDTMLIDTDRGVCTLSWRARVILDARDAAGRVTVRLARAEEPGVLEEPDAPVVVPASPATAAATPALPAAAPPATASAPEPSSIERCAVIAASCALRAADTAAILLENGLTEDTWDALESRWAQALRQEAAQGGSALLERYDRAYVARIEKERGPITPEAYTRLALAHERDRGALTRALRDLELPWGVTPRILRVFAARMAADPALAAKVRAAVGP